MTKGKCQICGNIIESKSRSDAQICKCGKSFIECSNDPCIRTITTINIIPECFGYWTDCPKDVGFYDIEKEKEKCIFAVDCLCKYRKEGKIIILE